MKGTATVFALGLAVPAGAQTVPPAPANRGAQLIGIVPAAPVDPIAEMIAVHRERAAVVHPCPREQSADIVVCGRRDTQSRYRLPLPEEAIDEDGGRIVRGELPRASTKPVRVGGCGVVQGDRPCVADTNNILTAADFLAKLFKKLTDPDADVEPPTKIPDRFRGAGR